MDCEIGLHEAFIELKQNICPFVSSHWKMKRNVII